MKHMEKKLSGFNIIYLHNPYKCIKCITVMKSVNNLDRIGQESLPKREMVPKKYRFDFFKPLKHLSLTTQKMLDDSEFMYPLPIVYSPVKTVKKVMRKRNFGDVDSKSFKSLPLHSKKYDNERAKTSSKLSKKKTSVDRSTKFSPVKKQAGNSSKKASGIKVPGKGTLKRKRWFLEKLNHKNDNYEDDLFEDQKFGHFQNLLEDESDNAEKYEELKTPVFPFSLSPRETTPSPMYKDCYSPTQLSISRKGAEEYQYRRMKRKKLNLPETKEEAPEVDQQERTEDVLKRLEEVAKILNTHQNQRERTSDNEDDQYYPDLLNVSS